MMSPEEFEQWAVQLNLTEEAKKEIQLIRNSPPSRRVGGGKYNVAGKYSSRKMGLTIQFESHKVELPAVYMMEFNDDVLEYYDQPPSLKLIYFQSKNGKDRKAAYLYTPDYFVIEKKRAYWVEWKTEEKLIKLSQERPDRYFREDGHWMFAPGISYAKQLNLEFLVRSSADINWNLQRNLTFLEDYIVKEYALASQEISRIKDVISATPGLTLMELIQYAEGQYSTDDIYALIAKNFIYIDLYNSVITQPESVKVFLNKEQSKGFTIVAQSKKQDRKINKIELESGKRILWGESPWTILNYDQRNKEIFLYSDDNRNQITLPIHIFEGYISDGYIKGIFVESETNSSIYKIISQATESDLSTANARYEPVVKYLNGEKIEFDNVTDRTVRNWVKKYRDAELLHGNGYLGLLPYTKKRGNRKARIKSETLELMVEMIDGSYATNKLKTAKAVYRELVVKCEEKNIDPPSYPTFCKAIKNRSIYELTFNREGSRAAYKHEEFYWELELTTPRHGERIFETAHIDHTVVDIKLVAHNNEIIKPWCTLMVDAYSRRILAFYLTFEPPSYRSCMMVLRECVKKYNRLPNYIVVDGGKEFRSIYFESLLASYGVHKKERPAAKARFGNVVERLFGVANKLFFHNLKGNTQIMKNVRQVTKTVNPKNHAVWTMESLYERLEGWINEVYDNLENESLNQTPKEAFRESLELTGNRPNTYIPYDETFILMTLPSVSGKTRKVHPGKGIKLTYSYYWSAKFRDPKVENSEVEVRYDPFNIGVAYALINNIWEKCLSEEYSLFNGKTEKQLKIIAEELRQKKKLRSTNGIITAKMIAGFILESENMEEMLALEKYKPIETKPNLTIVDHEATKNVTNIILEESEDDNDDDEIEIYGELI
ncbi:DDE-type integrase/transposase/recombinase [Bacillus sp. ISL-41]|uniref:DDE-type integrase/transposase/recombinase n=1 Tax=Bacillus sp. ISL-41 TaxID=2819127 RepID=UPI001BED31E1|nr:DDE-type integrase/transposase/recombinase [Bacillus sp. ISL-41]MBT2643434.1 DDE-type integrase/transposase/recombinase [Bacillus sp. ISL-41]